MPQLTNTQRNSSLVLQNFHRQVRCETVLHPQRQLCSASHQSVQDTSRFVDSSSPISLVFTFPVRAPSDGAFPVLPTSATLVSFALLFRWRLWPLCPQDFQQQFWFVRVLFLSNSVHERVPRAVPQDHPSVGILSELDLLQCCHTLLRLSSQLSAPCDSIVPVASTVHMSLVVLCFDPTLVCQSHHSPPPPSPPLHLPLKTVSLGWS